MPQIKVKGVELEHLVIISKSMIDELQEIIGCPRDYFTIEYVNSTFVMDGSIVSPPVIVDVAWFDRGQDVQDRVAGVITKHIQNLKYKGVDVIFTSLEKNRYYENGEHF